MTLSFLEDDGRVCSLRSEGDIRMGDLRTSGDPLEPHLINDRRGRAVLLDMSRTSYIDSSGVGWLVKHHKRCKDAGGTFFLHSVPPSVLSVLKLLHLERVLNVVEDERAARAIAGGPHS